MATWHRGAIGFGLVVELVLLFAALLFPPYGPIAVGIAGGLTAGALAGGGARPGARHGAVVGAVAAAVVALVGVGIGVTVGLGSGPLPGTDIDETTRLLWLLGERW